MEKTASVPQIFPWTGEALPPCRIDGGEFLPISCRRPTRCAQPVSAPCSTLTRRSGMARACCKSWTSHTPLPATPLFDGASATIPAGHKVGIVGRIRRGQDDAFPADPGAAHARWRQHLGGPPAPASGVSRRRRRAPRSRCSRRCWRRMKNGAALLGDTSDDPRPHRGVQTRLADIDAWSGEARASAILKGLGFTKEEQAMPCSALLGRLADARGAEPVSFFRPARPAAARRTDELPRPRRRALAGKLSARALPAYGADHQPRPWTAEPGGRSHPAPRGAGADTLFRRLRCIRRRARAETRAVQAAAAKKQEAQRAHLQAFVDRFPRPRRPRRNRRRAG